MIFYARQTNILLVSKWVVTKVIEDPNLKNINKYSFNSFPNFDLDNFPFVVVSGESTFNILNVKTGWMDALVKASTSALHA